MNLFLRTTFVASHKFLSYFYFNISPGIFISFLISLMTHWFFSSMLIFQFLCIFFQFSFCNWFLVSFHCGWKTYLYDFSFLNLLSFILWLNMWFILQNIPNALEEKNVYSDALGWGVCVCMCVCIYVYIFMYIYIHTPNIYIFSHLIYCII